MPPEVPPLNQGPPSATADDAPTDTHPASEMQPVVRAKPCRSKRGRGRPPVHGLVTLRKAVTKLGTRRLDGRSVVALAVRRWAEDVRADLGGDLSRAQETILEHAARSWLIVQSLDDWILRQPTLVTRKRTVVPVLMQRQQLLESLARLLDRLGLQRKSKHADFAAEIAAMHRERERERQAGVGDEKAAVADAEPSVASG